MSTLSSAFELFMLHRTQCRQRFVTVAMFLGSCVALALSSRDRPRHSLRCSRKCREYNEDLILNFSCLTDTNLKYYTTYQYKVVAENKAGTGESDISDVTTAQASPDDVYAPDWISQDRNTITLSWKPPGKLNGMTSRIVLQFTSDMTK